LEITIAPPRQPGLDTLRATAVLGVMFYHLTIFGELPRRFLTISYFGWMGVDLFFVLSGFLIGRQILRQYLNGQRPSILAFYRRRAYRILPAYFVVLALYFLVPGWSESPHLAPLWKFLTFTMNFGFNFDSRAFSHAWSLCVEEHFYLVLPLLVALLMRRPSVRKTVGVFAFVIVFGVVLRTFLITHYLDNVWSTIYYPTYTRLDGLLAGVGLATIRTFRPVWWRALMMQGHALFFTGVFCVGCVVWMVRNQNLGSSSGSALCDIIIGFPLLSVGLGLITASSVSNNGWLARFKIPGAETVATLAFTLYLTHKAVGNIVMLSFPGITAPQGPLSWVLYTVACVSAAWVLHIIVERPFLRLRDHNARIESITELEAEASNEPAL
jgi:peptidoglycan/LPS O-acetylase OafA/YrhL